ncbi:hypothetical protein [Azospirillum agricola]|uniref:hypothetical protein n=1 Tax=Azospirillum agricola TaxID=1720247 RepID=UPI000A1CDF1D|nr:hypothetical protein [Azospirillum agricola]
MWKDAANLMFFGIASLGLAYAAGKLVLLVGECRIRHHDGVRGMGATMACRARIEAGLQARQLERSRELATLEAEIEGLHRRRKQLERQLDEMQKADGHLIRIVGEEDRRKKCYTFLVMNKYVSRRGFHQNEYAWIDASWQHPQTVEVWARSIKEAQEELTKHYPVALGYEATKGRMRQHDNGSGTDAG